jgi:hypothetical protein
MKRLQYVVDALKGEGVYQNHPHSDVHVELDLARAIGELSLHLQRICELTRLGGDVV